MSALPSSIRSVCVCVCEVCEREREKRRLKSDCGVREREGGDRTGQNRRRVLGERKGMTLEGGVNYDDCHWWVKGRTGGTVEARLRWW